MSHTNTLEECNNEQNILDLYTSQRDEVLNKMNTENQNLSHAKETMEKELGILKEKIKFSHDLENENETIKEHIETGLEIRNELVNNIVESNELMNSNIERLNLLQNVIQLSINNQHKVENLKQEVINKFEKIINKKQDIQETYIEKIKSLSLKIDNYKEEVLKNIENYKSSNQSNMQEILNKQQMLINIQNERQNLNEILNKLSEEILIIEKENNNISNKQLELEKTVQEFNQQKDLEIADYNKKIFDLQKISNSINIETSNLEKNNLEEGKINKTAFWNSLINQKNNQEETISVMKTEYFDKEKEVNAIEEILQQDIQLNTDLNNLTKEIEDKKQNNWIHEKHISLKQKLTEYSTKENELDSQLRNCEEELLKKENEVKNDQEQFEELSNKFSNEIEVLRKEQEEQEQKEQVICNEKQEITTKFNKLDEYYEELMIKSDAATAEAEEDEISINMKIDTIKNEINNQKCSNKGIENDIKNLFVKEKQEKIKLEYEEKYKNINLDFEEQKNNLNELCEKNRKTKTEELRKIKESKTSLELQLSENKVCYESLKNALKLKIQQLEKLKEDLNKKTDKNAKQSDVYFKKPRHDSIPKYKFSPSKYSSTSDSSVENYSLAKRRKVSFRRRPKGKNLESSQRNVIQGSQKSINDVFDAIKPSSKRTIRKPVF